MPSDLEVQRAYDGVLEAIASGSADRVRLAGARLQRALAEARVYSWLRGGASLVGGYEASEAPTFREAIDSIMSRSPMLRPYGDGVSRGAFARAWADAQRSIREMRQRFQDLTVQIIREGGSVAQAREEAARLGVTESLAETAYRTIATSAYSRGQLRVARNPAVRGIVAGFLFDATMDRDTRPNHAAANGFAAPPDSPAWRVLTPALGFRCRCGLSVITVAEARRRWGVDELPDSPVPRGAGPDPGFIPEPLI